MTTPRTCRSCRWARWHLRMDGSPHPHVIGQCVYEFPEITLPLCAEVPKWPPYRYGIRWSDTRECPCWEEKKNLPTAADIIDPRYTDGIESAEYIRRVREGEA